MLLSPETLLGGSLQMLWEEMRFSEVRLWWTGHILRKVQDATASQALKGSLEPGIPSLFWGFASCLKSLFCPPNRRMEPQKPRRRRQSVSLLASVVLPGKALIPGAYPLPQILSIPVRTGTLAYLRSICKTFANVELPHSNLSNFQGWTSINLDTNRIETPHSKH